MNKQTPTTWLQQDCTMMSVAPTTSLHHNNNNKMYLCSVEEKISAAHFCLHILERVKGM